MAYQKSLAVSDLKDALTRIDRDQDGLIDFHEFDRGLRDLGINLPEREVMQIWNQAGSAQPGTSQPTATRPVAGMSTIDQEQQIKRKQPCPLEKRLDLIDHISDSYITREGAEISCLTGKHSHKKTGYKAGNLADLMIGTENGLTPSGIREIRSKKQVHTVVKTDVANILSSISDDQTLENIAETPNEHVTEDTHSSYNPKQPITGQSSHKERKGGLTQQRPESRAPYFQDEIEVSETKRDPARTKVEEGLRTFLQSKKGLLEKAFSSKAKGETKLLRAQELKQCLHNAGLMLSDMDFESVWRKMDDHCIGQVTLSQLQSTLNLHEPGDEPSAHFAHHETGPSELPASKIDSAEHRMGLAVLHRKTRFLEALTKTAASNGIVSESDFKAALASGCCVLSDEDAARLFSRASRNGKVDIKAVTESLNEIESIGDVNKSILGFGTGLTLLKAGGPAAKHNGSFGCDDPNIRELYTKIAQSENGNPRRLKQLFLKYDVDRSGSISRGEFINGLVTHNVPLSKEERDFLSQVVDVEGNGVVSYDAFVKVIADLSAVNHSGPKHPRNNLQGPYAYPEKEARAAGKPTTPQIPAASASLGNQGTASVWAERSSTSVGSRRSVASARSSTSSFSGSRADRGEWLTKPTSGRGHHSAREHQGSLIGQAPSQQQQAAPNRRIAGELSSSGATQASGAAQGLGNLKVQAAPRSRIAGEISSSGAERSTQVSGAAQGVGNLKVLHLAAPPMSFTPSCI